MTDTQTASLSGGDTADNITKAEAVATVAPTLPPVVTEVVDEITRAAEAEYVQVTASRVTPKFSAKVRNAIYTAGVVLGLIGTVAPAVVAVTTGDAQVLAASAGSIALALTNLLAKLNLSKTADDLAAEVG